MNTEDEKGFEGWPDWQIEGYWEMLDTAAQLNKEQRNDELAEQYQCLAQECEDTLRKRWAGK